MKKKLLLFSLLGAVIILFFSGCATSPFPQARQGIVDVQVVAKGRPKENIAIGVRVTNNTPNYIADVIAKIDSIDGNKDLAPFQLWNTPQELTIQDINKTSTLDSGKDVTFTFPVATYSYIEAKSYPMVITVTYKDSNGKETTEQQNNIVEVVAPNNFYKFMRNILDWIHRFVPNYGLAIVLLTIIIKLLTHPLTRKQFQSTSKMQAIQPEVKKLQQKYKDNPQKMNQEVMKVYKEHNVSMFGGCLPLLVQWPLLFILFGALNNYAPFNNSPFLWLKNINTPDQYYIMPILVFVSMFLQSKTSQLPGTPMDSNTRMMTYFLPAIFAVWAIRWAPSILLYWVTFSTVQLIEQTFILRSMRAASESPMSRIPTKPSKDVPETSQLVEGEAQVKQEKPRKERTKKSGKTNKPSKEKK
jgi:YidC/Oxa1 family membrane protein insertase